MEYAQKQIALKIGQKQATGQNEKTYTAQRQAV